VARMQRSVLELGRFPTVPVKRVCDSN
jgi:hypothetical protein